MRNILTFIKLMLFSSSLYDFFIYVVSNFIYPFPPSSAEKKFFPCWLIWRGFSAKTESLWEQSRTFSLTTPYWGAHFNFSPTSNIDVECQILMLAIKFVVGWQILKLTTVGQYFKVGPYLITLSAKRGK